MRKTQAEKVTVLFEEKEVRRIWHEDQWYFSIIDVVAILSESSHPRRYWSDLKRKLVFEGYSELYEKIVQLKLPSSDGKNYETDSCSIFTMFRVIQSIPSPKAEPFKQWLARVGQERIEEIQDPERAMLRAKKLYEQKGYSDEWIVKRMRGISVRNTLTNEWKHRGAKNGSDFAILTNEIYKGTFEMDAQQIKEFKSLSNPDNSRDHMNELELILTMLGESTTTELTTIRDSKGMPTLAHDAKEGGNVAGNARKEIEKKTGKKVVGKKSSTNGIE